MRSCISLIDPKWSGSGWNATIVEHVSNRHTETLGNVEVWYGPDVATIVVRIPSRKVSLRKVVNPATPKAFLHFIEDSTGYACDIEGINQAMDGYQYR